MLYLLVIVGHSGQTGVLGPEHRQQPSKPLSSGCRMDAPGIALTCNYSAAGFDDVEGHLSAGRCLPLKSGVFGALNARVGAMAAGPAEPSRQLAG